MSPRRRHRPFSIYRLIRAAVATVFVAGLIGVLAFAAAILLIDPETYKPEIEAAVQRATGRALALRGPMRLAFGLPPRLVAEDVTFANPPGLSRQEMLTLDRAEASVAPWPLLRGEIDIDDLTLVHPDLRLERGANGRGNWLFTPSSLPGGGPATSPMPARVPSAHPDRSRVTVRSIHIEAGRAGWRAGPDAPMLDLSIPRLDAIAGGPGGTLLLTGTISTQGRTLELNGEVGSLDRLFDRGPQLPWPVRVSVRDSGLRLSVSGSIADPISGKGPLLQVDASVSDFTALAGFLPPGVVAPHDATATVRWGDGGEAGDVGLTYLALHVGAVRLPALLPGVDIAHIDIAAPALDRPVHIDMRGEAATAGPLQLVANVAQLKWLLPGALPTAPVPIDATLDAGRALFSIKGTATDPKSLRGMDLDVFLRVPDVAAFSALAGVSLPALTQVAFEGHVIGDLAPTGGIGLRHATLTLPEAQFGGDADIRLGPRPSVHAIVSSPRIDLDMLLADLWPPAATDQPLPAAAATAPAPPAAPPPASAASARWLIPDAPMDLQALDRFDAEVRFGVDTLRFGGADDSAVSGTLSLRDGELVVDPLSGMTPGGAAEARLSIASRVPAMPVSLYLRAPSLQLAQLAPLLGAQLAATGTFGVDADLRGAGRSPHAIAGSLEGHVGLASTDAELDNRIVLALLKTARLPDIPLGKAGTMKPRCLVLRLDMAKGVATIGAMIADLQRLVVLGGGSADLGREDLDVQLRPMLRIGAGGGVVVPVRVGGTFLAPKAAVGVETKGGAPITGAGVADPCAAGLKMVFAGSADGAGPAIAVPAPAPPKPGAGAGSVFDVLKGLIK